MNVFKRQRVPTIVGLELDPSHIAAAEVSVNGGVVVTRGASAPLRPGILRDGEPADVPALSEALRTLFGEKRLSTRVRLGIAHQRIVVRTLDLPVMTDPKALAATVKAEAPDHIPMPMDEAVVDFQSLGVVETALGPRSRVVIVAVRREMIERLVRACGDAGLVLEGIDLAAFGMVRAVPVAQEGSALYVNVAGLTNVAVANASGCLFTRAASGGLEGIVHALSEARGLTLEHSAQWLQHVGLLADVAEIEGDPEVIAAARAALEEGVHHVADTVRNSVNFYRMQDGAEAVERGVLIGPAVGVPGFAERLSELLRLPLEPSVIAVESGDDAVDPGRLTVAAGLAIERRD